MNGFSPRRATASLALVLVLGGCAILGHNNSPVPARQFQFENLAKSDLDMMAEVQLRFSMETLRELMVKLYRRNPMQLQRGSAVTIEAAAGQLFGPQPRPEYQNLDGKASLDLIRHAFDAEFSGDRVLTLVAGLRGMIIAAHNGKQSFYFMDELDPQKLYHAARNIEIAAWRLSNSRDEAGKLYIISNATDGPVENLSYERLFGKLIALQDSMARVVAESTNRRIKTVIQSVASAVFIPI